MIVVVAKSLIAPQPRGLDASWPSEYQRPGYTLSFSSTTGVFVLSCSSVSAWKKSARLSMLVSFRVRLNVRSVEVTISLMVRGVAPSPLWTFTTLRVTASDSDAESPT